MKGCGSNSHRLQLKERLEQNERRVVILAAYQTGFPLRKIAEMMGSSHGYVKTIIERAKPLTQSELRHYLCQLKEDGKITVDEIAIILACNRRHVYRLLSAEPLNTSTSSKRGRPKAITPEMEAQIIQLVKNPATAHLSARQWYNRLFPNGNPSYHAFIRFIDTLPDIYRKRKRDRSQAAFHPAFVAPWETWEVDRCIGDIMVIDPVTSKLSRPEVCAVVDRASRAILAVGVAYRDRPDLSQKGRFSYDAELYGQLLAEAIRGKLTGLPAMPQHIVYDHGKIEESEGIAKYLLYHKVIRDAVGPYSPHGKPTIEGWFNVMHKQFEADLAGYLGSDNREKSWPDCWDGKIRHHKTSKYHGYGDAANRQLLTIDDYAMALTDWVKEWNMQPSIDPRFYGMPKLQILAEYWRMDNRAMEKYVETYLLPHVRNRTVYPGGIVRLYGREYFHPCLVALYEVFRKEAKVCLRYSRINRSTVYLFWETDDGKPPMEHLWEVSYLGDMHPDPYRASQAVWYNRDEHHEYSPMHKNHEARARAVVRAAREAGEKGMQVPITDPRRLFQYVAYHCWEAWEKFQPTSSDLLIDLETGEVLHNIHSGGGAAELQDTNTVITDEPTGLTPASPSQPALLQMQLDMMKARRAESDRLRQKRIEQAFNKQPHRGGNP